MEPQETVLSRFIAVGHRFEVADYARTAPGGSFTAPWSEIAADLRARAASFTEYRTSGERFTADILATLREGAPAPEPRHFLRSFSNAVAFKPIFDTSAFVRAFVLDPEPLDVERVRLSIANWRRLLETIGELESRLARLRRLRDRYEAWGEAVLAAATHEFARGLRRAAPPQPRPRRGPACACARAPTPCGSPASVSRRAAAYVREIDGEIAEKKALLAGSAAEGRLAASTLGLSMLERDRQGPRRPDRRPRRPGRPDGQAPAGRPDPAPGLPAGGPPRRSLRPGRPAPGSLARGDPAPGRAPGGPDRRAARACPSSTRPWSGPPRMPP